MSTYVIVGGHGKIGLLLAAHFAGEGDVVHSTIRSDAHRAEVEETGAIPVSLDIESADVDAFAAIFAGADAVIFSAGAGGDGNAARKKTVDLGGSLKSIAAAEASGVRRFVQVSAIGVDEELPADTDPGWRAYVDAKRDADVALRASSLDYTIVRPGGLTDDAGTGRVTVGTHVERGSVPRADVAAVIAAALADDSTIGAQFELVSGDVAIVDALATLQ
jgi:nucleoside-diphosphate-sugar epimerase